jgi:hypothetical protein
MAEEIPIWSIMMSEKRSARLCKRESDAPKSSRPSSYASAMGGELERMEVGGAEGESTGFPQREDAYDGVVNRGEITAAMQSATLQFRSKLRDWCSVPIPGSHGVELGLSVKSRQAGLVSVALSLSV